MPQLSGISRLRLSPGEMERLLREEQDRRRKLRITQVREKARYLAKHKLRAVRNEKVKQLEKLAERIKDEWEVERQIRISQLEQEYALSLKSVGIAHAQADKLDLGLERKAITVQLSNQRANERYAVAITKLHEDKRVEVVESEAVIQARELAMAKERLRAREVASMPPPLRSDLRAVLSKAKGACVQLTDADTYTYPYVLPVDKTLVERNDESFKDGLAGAEEENLKRGDYERENYDNIHERLEKARVRGAHAIRRERMRQDYDNMMTELDQLEKADRKHRQQNLENIPQSLYLPAHVVADREIDRQTQMELKVEEAFGGEFDHVDLRANAPSLNYETTPTITEITSCSPSEAMPKPPVWLVRDRHRTALQNVTNTSGTSESYTVETGSEQKRKQVLKRIMKKIDKQKEDWLEENDEESPAAVLEPEAKQEQVVSRGVNGKDMGEETTGETLSQVPDVSSSQSGELMSQTRITSSGGDTTTSSELIDRQRRELMEYMRSLESQIGGLEALKKDKEELDKEESLTAKLEAKLALGMDSIGEMGAETTRSTAETATQVTVEDTMEQATETSIRSESNSDITQRRPNESTWAWYLRQKASVGESIKQKLDQITSAERGYELNSEFFSPTHGVPGSLKSPSYASAAAQPQELPPNLDSLSPLCRPVPSEILTDYREAAAQKTTPPPPGYISVSQREALARGESVSPILKSSGSRLENATQVQSEYLPVQERERLLQAPLSISEDAHQSSIYGDLQKDQLQREVDEHSLRLDRLRVLMSTTSSNHLDQSGKQSILFNQSTKNCNRNQTSAFHPIDQPLLLPNQFDQSTAKPDSLTQSSAEDTQLNHSTAASNALNHMETELLLLGQVELYSNERSETSKPDAINQSSLRSAQLEQSVQSGISQSYMSVEERESLIRTVSSKLPARSDGYSPGTSNSLTRPSRPTWHQVLTGRSDESAEIGQQNLPLPFVAQTTPLKESESSSAVQTFFNFASNPQSMTGWSAVHHQMLARQQQFNRKQEELRRQLANIQEQKRRLLAPSNQQELVPTQHSLRDTLQELGIDLADVSVMESTPFEKRDKPPITAQPHHADHNLHELSIIQEVDTPTHLTSYDESTLLRSLNLNANARSHSSRSTESSQEMTLGVALSEAGSSEPMRMQQEVSGPIREQRRDIQPLKDQNVEIQRLLSPQSSNTQQKTPPGESEQSGTPNEEKASSQTTDFDRIHVLNQLLQQLEARRVERESFLEKEMLTTLSSQSVSQSSPDLERRSSGDHYSSSTDDDAGRMAFFCNEVVGFVKDASGKLSHSSSTTYGRLLSSTDTIGSINTGDTLTQQMVGIEKKLMEQSIPLPDNIEQDNSESTNLFSGQKRQSAACHSQVEATGTSPQAENIKEPLQGLTSESNSDSPLITLQETSEPNLSPFTPTKTVEEAQSTALRADHLQQILQTINLAECSIRSNSRNATLSQSSESSSSLTKGEELNQAMDPSLCSGLQEETLIRLLGARGASETSSGSTATHFRTLTAGEDESVFTSTSSPETDDRAMRLPRSELVEDTFGTQATTVQSSTPMKALTSRLISSTPQKDSPMQVNVSGVLDEQEITFASTVADATLVDEEVEADWCHTASHGQSETGRAKFHWSDVEQSASNDGMTTSPTDGRPKATVSCTDSVIRKRQKREMMDRTKRLYSQLEEVKDKKAYKAREERRVDSQTRRKEYSNKLQARAKRL
ncbi:centrosomal protein of 295 kDa-like [Watersipora subatra]|uniref:centrosomal protein of 295 kDa-like n=1 Tax=Watersipora subatra TaxID=2589382 RepID=UPI00355B6A94